MEWYQEEFSSMGERKLTKKREYYQHPSSKFIEPFRIADKVWYVGDKAVCVHLIETSRGLVLIDSGYFHTNHVLVESIRRLGFSPSDVRWILHTHEHFDHIGAADEFRSLYGTKSAISASGAASIRENPRRVLMEWSNSEYQQIPHFDYEMGANEVFDFGDVKIRTIPTPGHALGVTSFFMEVTDHGEAHLAGLFGGAGIDALRLEYLLSLNLPLDMPQRMLRSIELIYDEPVTIHLGNHPGDNQMLEKRKTELNQGGNPFVNADSWHEFLNKRRVQVMDIISENEEKARRHGISLWRT